MDLSVKMACDIPSVISHHLREGNFNWPMLSYISLVHVAALVGLVTIPKCSLETLLFSYSLLIVSGLGVTVGSHRLWSHRSFEAAFPVRLVLMLMNSLANQGSIFHWARDHRVHHKHSETTSDPHDATRGFFFAHMGWLLVRKHDDVKLAGRELDCTDLLDDPVVALQRRLDPWFSLYVCFALPATVARHGWGEDYWNAFFVAGCLRYVAALHCTWLVNSAAHFYGDRPYDGDIHPAENPFVALWTIGEGWHNWHHKYPYDYAASEFGVSSQFNPSKVFIDCLASVGLVWGRKRASDAWLRGKIRRDRDGEVKGTMGSQQPRSKRPWEMCEKDKDAVGGGFKKVE